MNRGGIAVDWWGAILLDVEPSLSDRAGAGEWRIVDTAGECRGVDTAEGCE